MYGDKKCDKVDQLRAKLFRQKFENGKTVGLSFLHPCAKKSSFTHGVCKLCCECLQRTEAVNDAFRFTYKAWLGQ